MWKRALGATLLAATCIACAGPTSTVRGHYYWGHEVEAFTPCGSKESFWVVGAKSVLQPLRDKALAAGESKRKPYQPVYVEVAATPEPKTAAAHDIRNDSYLQVGLTLYF